MHTRCPYPECAHEFETEVRRGVCPSCAQPASFKDLDIIKRIEREYDRRLALGLLSGDPLCRPDMGGSADDDAPNAVPNAPPAEPHQATAVSSAPVTDAQRSDRASCVPLRDPGQAIAGSGVPLRDPGQAIAGSGVPLRDPGQAAGVPHSPRTEPSQERRPRLMVLVEDVRSLWNVGSIFRTADGAGFDKIFLCGITGAPPRKEITKTSLGAEESVAWQYIKEPVSLLRTMRDNGVFVLSLERTENSKLLSDLFADDVIKESLLLVVGNEVTGVSPECLHLSDAVAHLPMRGVKESLNVSVAFGIAAYALADAFPAASCNH